MIYITTPDNIWAIDARSARQLWRYTYPANQGFHIGHRGAAVYKDSVFLTTPDAHLVALDARTGTVKWNVEIADCEARLLVDERAARRSAITCWSACPATSTTCPGMLKSFDPEIGAHAVDVLQHAAGRHARTRRAAAPPAGRCG